MKFSYLCFAVAVIIAFLSAGYPGAETWIAAGVVAFAGVICLFVERRKRQSTWTCDNCGRVNSSDYAACINCNVRRP